MILRSILIAGAALADLVNVNAQAPDIWRRENVAAWCIVPYDAKRRGPEDRAVMLERLQVRSLAYDFRDEHVPTFDAEVAAMRQHHVDIVAWWFPLTLNNNAHKILQVIERYGIHPELWVMGTGKPVANAAEQRQRVEQEAARIRPIAEAAARLGCSVGLYNHGSWFGEPENALEVLQQLRKEGHPNVKLVYNFHHGHGHISRFAAMWQRIHPFVSFVNLNGMANETDPTKNKILYLGEGEHELAMMRIIQASGWRGRVGVINHRTDVDAEEGLSRNLNGLEKLAVQLRNEAAAKTPDRK